MIYSIVGAYIFFMSKLDSNSYYHSYTVHYNILYTFSKQVAHLLIGRKQKKKKEKDGNGNLLGLVVTTCKLASTYPLISRWQQFKAGKR